MSHRRFATAINCIDGQTQIPVIDYVRKKYRVDYVDMVRSLDLHLSCDSSGKSFYCKQIQ